MKHIDNSNIKNRKNKKLRKVGVASAAAVIFITATAAFAFDWPQDDTTSSSFHSLFGQFRGGMIESTLVFKDSHPVTCAEKGNIACIMNEHDSEMGWFESTLGNAVIVSHDDQLLTVYANLDGETIPEFSSETTSINAGDFLGQSGNSGWQMGRSCLEFMVIDTKNDTAINPRILMPRTGREPTLSMGTVTINSKEDEAYDLREVENVPAGMYYVYKTRQQEAIPYKTSVSVNGATIESISFDSLKEVDGRLCATGNSNYSADTLYPDEERMFLAKVMLTTGKNIISITITDLLGNSKTEKFSVNVY